MLRLKYFYLPPVELGVLSHLFGVQEKPKALENKGFRRCSLASIRGFEPPTPRLGAQVGDINRCQAVFI